MPFDGFLIRALTQELGAELIGKKIDRITQPHRDSIILGFRKHNLFISMEPSMSYFTLTDSKFENPKTPPMFCMLLRKHLMGASLEQISQLGLDRVVTLKFRGFNSIFEPVDIYLVIESFGRRSNLLLLDSDRIIIDCFKKSSLDDKSSRLHFPGSPYKFPEDDRIDITSQPDEGSGEVLSRYQGFNKVSASIPANFENWRDIMLQPQKKGYIYIDKNNVSKDYYHIPEALHAYYGDAKIEEAGSITKTIDTFYTRSIKELKQHQVAANLKRHISTRISRISSKIIKLEAELKTAENSEEYAKKGSLLLSNLHIIPGNADSVTLPDYENYLEDGPDGPGYASIKIRLDTRLSAADNAQKYFTRYKKLKGAVKFIQRQIRKAKSDLKYLDSALTLLDNSEDIQTTRDIKKELEQAGFVKAKKPSKSGKGRKKNEKQARPSFYEFTLSSGKKLLLGKSNISNDYLSLKFASNKDHWLHTRNIPGSHAVIRTEGAAATDQDIFEAATIAANYSKARNSSKVPVDHCLIRNIRKPRGARPGMVIYNDFETILVDPDHELSEKLRIGRK